MKALSPATVSVLKAIAAGERHGFDIMDLTGLPSGTVYPILGRLEKGGLVRARWESTASAHRDKRPPRRYYEIAAAGSKALARSIEYYRALTRALPAGLPRPSHG
jgi:PadR family transcriptional regulator PadR